MARWPALTAALAFLILAGSLAVAGNDLEIVPRENELRKFPCQECHGKPNLKKTLPHLTPTLKHMKDANKCSTCHDDQNLDQLVMLDGSRLGFNDSARLCGQCHGEKLADWKSSAHGKQTGSWSGTKRRLTCTACHEPHAPKFAEMTPYAAPKHPRHLVRKKEEAHHE